MAVTRTYTSKEDCARLMVSEDLNNIDETLITDNPEWFEHWEFLELADAGDEADAEDGLTWCEPPMWGTWFEIADTCMWRFVSEHMAEVAGLGFTLIFRDAELWGLGIDGAGYDFYEAHWVPLYELQGLEWHDEPQAA